MASSGIGAIIPMLHVAGVFGGSLFIHCMAVLRVVQIKAVTMCGEYIFLHYWGLFILGQLRRC